jgi:hypothetical protein
MARTVFAGDGSPVELGDHCYHGGQYSVDVMI